LVQQGSAEVECIPPCKLAVAWKYKPIYNYRETQQQ